ncbi:hypothetical protein KHP62_04325 [Rhodobacteraceae bacterium NNCM2]|nr:hypothetical protein [Coraliihabitans acroporae]
MPRYLILAASLGFLAMPQASIADSSQWASEIHQKAMAKSTDYRTEGRSKVMAACITWPDTREGTPVLHGVAYATAAASGKDIGPGRLRNSAQNRCIGWEAKNNVDCTCEFLDVNGKNVLQVPTY